jgi:hypothetical protein
MMIDWKERQRDQALRRIALDMARALYHTDAPTDEQVWPVYQMLRQHFWNWKVNDRRTADPHKYRPTRPPYPPLPPADQGRQENPTEPVRPVGCEQKNRPHEPHSPEVSSLCVTYVRPLRR